MPAWPTHSWALWPQGNLYFEAIDSRHISKRDRLNDSVSPHSHRYAIRTRARTQQNYVYTIRLNLVWRSSVIYLASQWRLCWRKCSIHQLFKSVLSTSPAQPKLTDVGICGSLYLVSHEFVSWTACLYYNKGNKIIAKARKLGNRYLTQLQA